ncbi:MAG TPA: hypothetical protein VGH64_16190 [Puia sp.]
MKKVILLYLVAAMSLFSFPAFSQAKGDTKAVPKGDTSALGMAGDNLDLAAVLDLFQKSKTIEGFEKSLNDEKLKINNLDLDLNKKMDFIKVVTKKDGNNYTFILQVDVSKKETQDVAVILLDKDKNGKISLQIVGDPDLYGKDYVIEPVGNSSVTANPGYVGPDPVTKDVPASTTVVVQSAPIVQYVYSPAYVPYVPPYYYGYPPPWFGFATVMAVGIYRSNHYYGYHGGYHGGHYGGGNTVVINNRNQINHYNNNRNRSTTVSDNMNRGNYGNGSGNRGGASASNRPSAGTSNRPGNGAAGSNRPSAGTSDRQSPSNRQSPSTSNRQSPSTSNRQSSFNNGNRSGSYGGGGRSMGGGGGSRGGGGGRRR